MNGILDSVRNSQLPVPMCLINEEGTVIASTPAVSIVFRDGVEDGADFYTLTGVKAKDISAENSGKFLVRRDTKLYKIRFDDSLRDTNHLILVFFDDVTDYEELKEKYDSQQICIARVSIDNYDEFTDMVSPEAGTSVTAQVEKIIRTMASNIKATIDKVKDTLYVLYFQKSFLNSMESSEFEMLDTVRSIETETDFPLTLSIGIGVGGADITETNDFAVAALELALARGGDQAIVREGDKLRYYGGTTQSRELGSKGKSRIIGIALSKLIGQSERVLIMGHKNADFDSLGASLGIFRMCVSCGAEAHIVMTSHNSSLDILLEQLKEFEKYDFIDGKKARRLLTPETLLVVVDTQRLSYLDSEGIIDKAERVVVIDHHRRSEDYIPETTLSYVETYASSTSELVAEMLQFVVERREVWKKEAEGMLAGIMLDTNFFTTKTGVRTFEACAWLRRAGADTTEVKRFFQINKNEFIARSRASSNAVFHEGGIATAILDKPQKDVQIINSQTADELLTIQGITAAFVVGTDEKGQTFLSARSLGDINVQLIAEKLGGGGHLTTSGAQVDLTPEDTIDAILDMLEKGEVKCK
ncbi:MAG: DHH family phosphoesterase [Eubacterium sp.]|jgi:c-di-AMP phosphodiesterase-like protein